MRMSGNNLVERATELIQLEASLLDRKNWSDWLELYLPGAEFWLPAWDDDGTLTDDPRTQISLMYYDTRSGLEDRVRRIQSGMSSASVPLPRTCHLVTGVRLESQDGDLLHMASSWAVHSFRQQQTVTFYGHYEHVLRADSSRLRIQRKKIIVMNDVIPGVLDIYNV